MKKILFFVLLLLPVTAAVAQRIRIADLSAYDRLIPVDTLVFTVQYSVSIVEDTEKPDSPAEESMMLRVGKSVSEYYSYTSFVADSVLRADVQAGASQQTIIEHLQQFGFGAVSHRIYKNYPAGRLTLLDRIATDNFEVEEPMPAIPWEILADTMTVCGYQCQKAVASFRGRAYEAWFAPGIPRSDGPWKLHGLPGLILKAEDAQQHYRFHCTGIGLSRTPALIEIPENSRRKVSRSELNRLYERFNADPQGYIRVSAPGVTVSVKDELGNEIRKMSNPYNPMELD